MKKRDEMIFEIDKDSEKIMATIQRNDTAEKYECSLLSCNNPVCACQTVYLNLSPLQDKNKKESLLSSHSIDIDLIERKLAYPDEKKIPKDDLAFAEFFLSNLGDSDFQFLYGIYFVYKNNITEKAKLDAIDAYFDYEEVEKEGLMYAYNDVLPYGDQMSVDIDGRNCIIFDQYCLLPKCPCTDTNLNIMLVETLGEAGEELCSVSLKYAKKSWEALEGGSLPVSLKAVRSAIESEIPDFYEKLRNRHLKLKGIYAHCKKRNFAPKQPIQVPKVGRNDPCPCGSGKKYKKCCLR
jgi:hypothetical protein